MILEPLARLIAEPIHEEADFQVRREHGAHHRRSRAERGKPRPQAEQQSERADRFTDDHQKGEHTRNVHRAREVIHRAAEAITPKPTEQLLGAVRQHHRPQQRALHIQSLTRIRLQKSLEHLALPFASSTAPPNRNLRPFETTLQSMFCMLDIELANISAQLTRPRAGAGSAEEWAPAFRHRTSKTALFPPYLRLQENWKPQRCRCHRALSAMLAGNGPPLPQ